MKSKRILISTLLTLTILASFSSVAGAATYVVPLSTTPYPFVSRGTEFFAVQASSGAEAITLARQLFVAKHPEAKNQAIAVDTNSGANVDSMVEFAVSKLGNVSAEVRTVERIRGLLEYGYQLTTENMWRLNAPTQAELTRQWNLCDLRLAALAPTPGRR